MRPWKDLKKVLAAADEPDVVADVVLKAAVRSAETPICRRGRAHRMRLLRSLNRRGVLDAGIRKDLRLDALAKT